MSPNAVCSPFYVTNSRTRSLFLNARWILRLCVSLTLKKVENEKWVIPTKRLPADWCPTFPRNTPEGVVRRVSQRFTVLGHVLLDIRLRRHFDTNAILYKHLFHNKNNTYFMQKNKDSTCTNSRVKTLTFTKFYNCLVFWSQSTNKPEDVSEENFHVILINKSIICVFKLTYTIRHFTTKNYYSGVRLKTKVLVFKYRDNQYKKISNPN